MAGESDVRMRFFGNEADAERAIVALEKKYDDLLNKVNQVAKQSKKGAKETDSELVAWVKGLFGVQAAYTVVSTAVRSVVDENVRLSQAIDQVLSKLPEKEIKLRIQTGLSAADLERQMPTIERAVLKTPTTDLFGAMDIQRGLAGAGFREADVTSGAALEAVLQMKAATLAFGGESGDPLKDAMRVTQFLKGLGNQTPTAGQIAGTGGRLAKLFETSDIQFADLENLAPIASSLKGLGIDEQTQLAAFAALVDVEGGPKAATGLMQVTSRLRNASQLPKAVGAIESLGMSPEDVDLIGESFPEALARLRDARGRVDEKTYSDALFNIFGQDASPSANMALGLVDKIEQNIRLQEAGSLESGVDVFNASRFARGERTKIETQIAARNVDLDRGGLTYEEARDELNLLHLERTQGRGLLSRTFVSAQRAAAGAALKAGELLSLTPEESGLAAGAIGGQVGILGALTDFAAAQRDQTEELRQINQSLRTRRDRNANGE